MIVELERSEFAIEHDSEQVSPVSTLTLHSTKLHLHVISHLLSLHNDCFPHFFRPIYVFISLSSQLYALDIKLKIVL
jgi:hypothetical protein